MGDAGKERTRAAHAARRRPGGLTIPAARMRCSAALVMACTVLAACGGSSGAPETSTVEVERATGAQAKTEADATVNDPRAIRVRIVAEPAQAAYVSWGLSCNRSADPRSKLVTTSGSYDVQSADLRPLKLPAGALRFCAVTAIGTLEDTGRVTVEIIATS